MDWNTMIDAARAENANGVQMRGNKRYTTTAIRVEMMRRHAGALSISTEIIRWAAENGSPIVVKATIADEAGRVLATGHAEEIRGKGNVNATSALENAETSAIGRALAALGLAGGEFASANEMDGVERKAEAIAERNVPSTYDPRPALARVKAAKTGLDLLTALKEPDCDNGHQAIIDARRAQLRSIVGAASVEQIDAMERRFNPADWESVQDAAQARKAQLTQKDAE